MEKIYKYDSSDLISIKDEFTAYRQELKLHENNPLPTTDENIKKLLDIEDQETYQELLKSVDLDDLLSQPDDVRVMPFKPTITKHTNRKPVVEIPKQALHLNTFRGVITYKKKYSGSPFGRPIFANRYPETEYSSAERDLKPYEDVLISIRFYLPFRSAQRGIHAKPRFGEEFLVRGDQYLTELRDRITCESVRPLHDISDNPEQPLPELKTNPGFFFITDTFYNDMRNPENHDYSDIIMKWAATRPPKAFTANFKTAKMEQTRFRDLNVRLGYPQVYQHFGNCEHIFTFSWIQLISPKDHMLSTDYPILRSCDLSSTVLCNVCGLRQYSFIVTNSNRHLHDPVYLCRICFNSYHYIDGVKIGEFKAFYHNPDPGEIFSVSSDEEEAEDAMEVCGEEILGECQ